MEFKKVLVPVVGSEADEGAMKLACRLAKKDKGKVWAVSVVAIKRALPLDAEIDSEIQKAENVLDTVESVAEEEDYEVETDVLVHLDLVDASQVELDRILRGGDVFTGLVQLAERGVERGRLARARRTSDQHHPIGLVDRALEDLQLFRFESELRHVELQIRLVEETQHRLLAE